MDWDPAEALLAAEERTEIAETRAVEELSRSNELSQRMLAMESAFKDFREKAARHHKGAEEGSGGRRDRSRSRDATSRSRSKSKDRDRRRETRSKLGGLGPGLGGADAGPGQGCCQGAGRVEKPQETLPSFRGT